MNVSNKEHKMKEIVLLDPAEIWDTLSEFTESDEFLNLQVEIMKETDPNYDEDTPVYYMGCLFHDWPSEFTYDQLYPGEVNYYRACGCCHHIAPLMTYLMQKAFPDEGWHTLQGDLHSATFNGDMSACIGFLEQPLGRTEGMETFNHCTKQALPRPGGAPGS